ncbi:MFS transporter [Streptomyces tropicalis]|uniref:MFS transporter n=1 Tax=Streptomyces tropicalis TaxID=3034234 RepID=A0ABT6A3Z9_9ACTN|nr:MFS transporter [Streptomyces tropicalis]MDF3299182.1 MFS transporter [Streptomyces tropicalis]
MSRAPQRAGGEESAPDTAPTAAAPAARTGGRRDLAVLWGVNAVDGLGSQASGLVFPLLLLRLGHGPGTAGAVAAAAALAGVLLGPLVAVPADRGRRRRIMTGAAAVAALATAGLAVSCRWHPPLWVLLGLACAERLSATAYEAAARGALARLADPEDLPRAVAGIQAGDQAALVAGPALGGALFGVSRFLPFAVDAVSYLVAAVGVRAIRAPLDGPAGPVDAGVLPPGPAPRRRGPARGELRAGAAAVVRSPALRLVLLWSTAASGALALLFYTAVFVLGAGAGGAATGAVLAASGAAGLAGSLAAPRVVRRFGGHRSLTAATWLLVPSCAALAAADGPWRWALCFCALCLVMPVVTVVLGGAAVLAVPREVQSRTGAVLGTSGALAAAAAPAVAAALVVRVGAPAPALLCTAVLALLAVHTQRTARTALRPAASAPEPAGGSGPARPADPTVPAPGGRS